MVRLTHRPYGREHPYAVSPDQRDPVLPEADQPFTVGVLVDGDVDTVTCEWTCELPQGELSAGPAGRLDAGPAGRDGGPVRIHRTPAVPAQGSVSDLVGGEGHLADAQAESLATDGSWQAELPGCPAGSLVRYRFVAAGVATEWFEVRPAHWQADVGALGLDDPARLAPNSVQWLVNAEGAHAIRFALRLAAGEHVVGFGERFDAVDQRGRRLDCQVFEQYKSQGEHGRTYLPMPFAHVIGGNPGWGLHVRTSRRVWFDVGQRDTNLLWVTAQTDPTGRLDVGLYAGHPREVLDCFLSEVGRAEQLPPWVFRLWASGNEWNTQATVMHRMDRHRELDIPVGVVVIEAWSDEEGITIFRDAQYEVNADGSAHAGSDFSYPDDGAWPDPHAMVNELHERDIKVILWQIPLLKDRSDLPSDLPDDAQVLADGRALVDTGHAVLEADGSPYHNRGWWFPRALMPDLSTRDGRDYWTQRRRYLVRDIDIDGFKTDGGEHAWGHDLRYADGRRGDEGNNRFPVQYARAFGDLLRSEGKAPVTFSRSGFTGSQAHGVFWAGDENSTWQAFRNSITAGITASACGIVYWGWDLAGFSGPVPDAELYVRAAAASTFMPIMQYHSEFNHHRLPNRDRTPWQVAQTAGDSAVIDEFRELVALRERLVPYLEASAADTIATSAPLMRGLFFDYPGDERAWWHPGQFLLGPDLLINPVTAPNAAEWSTYLPTGDWVDVWSGHAHAGGQLVSRPAPRAIIPVYCRAQAWGDLRDVFGA